MGEVRPTGQPDRFRLDRHIVTDQGVHMSIPIFVTGGTGTLGRHLTPRLREAGREVRVLSRHRHDDAAGVSHVTGDLATGEGIDRALDGVETVVHLAGSSKGDEVKAQRLVRAAGRAEIRHLVYISVVGAGAIPLAGALDRAMFGNYGAKFAAEQIIAESGIPWTTLRATQFHDLIFALVRQMAKLPVILAPAGARFQPVDAGEVAARLADVALGDPAGLVPEFGGPRIYEVETLLRGYLDATQRKRLIVPLSLPGQAARAFRAGANLTPGRAVGRRTWEEFLAERLNDVSTPSSAERLEPEREATAAD
jgi:uncharacterized protein YbjT (DUF2867 family)